MENNFRDIEWIERYLNRSLTGEEKLWMEKRLEAEPELKSKLNEHKQLVEGIRYSHIQNRLEQLRTLESSLPPIGKEAKTKEVFMFWKPVAVAATVLVLITSYYLVNQSISPQDLYTKRFQPYPNVFEPTVRGNTNAVDERTAAFRAYDQGDYVTASHLFTKLNKQKTEPGILLLLGNSNLILGKTAEAQNNFLTLIMDFEELEAQAKWYLALSYLKQGESGKANLILQELSDPQVTYSKKAKELLENMK